MYPVRDGNSCVIRNGCCSHVLGPPGSAQAGLASVGQLKYLTDDADKACFPS